MSLRSIRATIATIALLSWNVGGLHQRDRCVDIVLEELFELNDRHRHRLDTELLEALLHRRLPHRFRRFLMQLFDDRAWSLRRQEHAAVKGINRIRREAGFDRGRHLWHAGGALVRAHRERNELALAN